jgi:hypothetical protein
MQNSHKRKRSEEESKYSSTKSLSTKSSSSSSSSSSSKREKPITRVTKQRRKAKYCIHEGQFYKCKICSPQNFCKLHGILYADCPDCNNTLSCSHSRWKKTCSICRPNSHCIHTILRSNCRICNKTLVCEHHIHRYRCSICNPGILCDAHQIIKYNCRKCQRDRRKSSSSISPTIAPDISIPSLAIDSKNSSVAPSSSLNSPK